MVISAAGITQDWELTKGCGSQGWRRWMDSDCVQVGFPVSCLSFSLWLRFSVHILKRNHQWPRLSWQETETTDFTVKYKHVLWKKFSFFSSFRAKPRLVWISRSRRVASLGASCLSTCLLVVGIIWVGAARIKVWRIATSQCRWFGRVLCREMDHYLDNTAQNRWIRAFCYMYTEKPWTRTRIWSGSVIQITTRTKNCVAPNVAQTRFCLSKTQNYIL